MKAAASVRHSGGLFRVHWTASQTRSDPRLSPAEGVQRVQSFRDCRQRTGESRELSGPSRTCMGSSSGHLAPRRGSILKLCTLRNPTPSCTLNACSGERLGARASPRASWGVEDCSWRLDPHRQLECQLPCFWSEPLRPSRPLDSPLGTRKCHCESIRARAQLGSMRSVGMSPSRTGADDQASGPSRLLVSSSLASLAP